MINRENLIKIWRVGGNTSNQETPDQIGRVGISASKEFHNFYSTPKEILPFYNLPWKNSIGHQPAWYEY